MTQEYISACEKIESDKNFQPHVTEKGLINSVRKEDGTPKHTSIRYALTIQPLLENKDPLYKVYQVKTAILDHSKRQENKLVWKIDQSDVIVVNKLGHCFLHLKENIQKGILNKPLRDKSFRTYLDQKFLVFEEKQRQIAEIKKNARLLYQAYNNGTGFFARLMPELLTNIAALTADKEILSEEETYTIAHNSFNCPK